MTQGFSSNQFTIFSLFSAKRFVSKLPFQTGLSALLLVSTGVTVLPTEVSASSKKLAQIVVPTTTDPTPTTNQTPTNQVPTTNQTPTNQVPTTNQTPATNQVPTTTPTPTNQVPTTNQTPATNQVPTTTPTPTNQVPTTNQTPATNQVPTTTPTPTNQVPTTTPANATVIYVNPATGTDSASAGSTEAAPYKTITYALGQAQPGTVIQLAPGNYTIETGEVFPLTIKSGVTLRGEESSKGQTRVIIGGGIYVSPTFARQNVTIRGENDSAVLGVTVVNPNTRGTGLWIESTNPTVRNNTFTINNRDGVFITGTATPIIEGNVFTQNSGNGISVARSAQGEIRNNLFLDTGFGLAIGGNSTPLVTGNQLYQNRAGMFISDSARPTLRNNVIENSKQDGVVVTASAQPDLGTAENQGQNFMRGNSRYDVNNSTRSNTIAAVGNDIDPQKIAGNINFVAATVERPAISGGTFRDIQGYWAQRYIEALVAKNIIAGFPDGSFRPTDPVTRAQFATIISKAFTPQPQRQAQDFRDVQQNFWAYQAIQNAYRGGFVAGYPGGVFQPQQEIPRVQVLVSLANGLKLSADNPSALSVYADASQIPSYATGPVAAATTRQLVVNYPTPNQLNPNRPATRAEVAAFVYQALVNTGRAAAIPSSYVVGVANSNINQNTQQPAVPQR